MVNNLGRKCIVLDDPTAKFLGSLRILRKARGLRQTDIVRLLGLSRASIKGYEQGKKLPSLSTLFKLADFFCVNLSENVNHKVFTSTLSSYDIKQRMKRYGLTCRELERLTGYSRRRVSDAVNLKTGCSVQSLAAVLDVLNAEYRLAQLRNQLLSRGRRQKNGTGANRVNDRLVQEMPAAL